MSIWRVPYPKFGAGPGLERVQTIAEALGLDIARFGVSDAVIVGSNGKGSTAAMAAALLQQASAPVGLFTSPHLFDLNERFRIDGEDISDAELDHHWRRVADAAARVGEAENLGGFEFLFLIAADWFTARRCAHVVWEAGIGGRLDPVRLIQARRLALTSLDLEHTYLLGETLEEIARDKLDAAPMGARVFVSESCAAQREAIEAHCAERGVNVTFVAEHDARGVEALSLRGAFQARNAALAWRAAADIVGLSDDKARAGFAAIRWPGRMEILSADPLVVIDVGHTPAGVRAVREAFTEMAGDAEALLVCGASSDKDAGALIGALAPGFSTIICAAARHKGEAPARIAAYARAANAEAEIVVSDSVSDARATALARARGRPIFVAGGLFLAAEFRAVHLGRDPASLAFF
ncbi:MAG: hypothetical protein J0L81_06645 [Caulobacterales bacterium]|nr:hypothetical protein [Caulobacterales bacterium]